MQMLELVDKGIKKVMKTVFSMLKKLSRDMKDTTKNQTEHLEIKITVCEVKNTLEGINGRLDISKEEITEGEDTTIGTVNNGQRKKWEY